MSQKSGDREASIKSNMIGNFISFHHWREWGKILFMMKNKLGGHMSGLLFIFLPLYFKLCGILISNLDENTML